MLVSKARSDPELYRMMHDKVVYPNGVPILPVDINTHLPPDLVETWNELQIWTVNKAKVQGFRDKPCISLEPACSQELLLAAPWQQ